MLLLHAITRMLVTPAVHVLGFSFPRARMSTVGSLRPNLWYAKRTAKAIRNERGAV